MSQSPSNLPKKISFRDSFVFVFSMAISALIAAQFIGLHAAIAWTSFSVLCTYALYNAKPDRSNLLYVALWIILIFSSSYIGQLFHLTWKFYLFLFIISYFYYYLFGRDPVFDRAIRFVIIFATIGTALPIADSQLAMGGAIGTLSALLISHYLLRKEIDLEAFKQGIFTHDLFRLDTNLIPRAFIYSSGLFLSLIIPQMLGIEKNYWATITFLMVMPPKAMTVIHNTWLRFWGSVIAVIALFILFQISLHIPINRLYIMVALLFFFAFLLPICFKQSYLIVTFGVTCYSLVLVELGMYWDHPPKVELLIDRIIETFIGGIIAIIISLILKVLREDK